MHELSDVFPDELSGVKDPANKKRRWLLMKSEDRKRLAQETLTELERVLLPAQKSEASEQAAAALAVLAKEPGVPEDVLAAIDTVREWCVQRAKPAPAKPPAEEEAVSELKSEGGVRNLLRALGGLLGLTPEEKKAVPEKPEETKPATEAAKAVLPGVPAAPAPAAATPAAPVPATPAAPPAPKAEPWSEAVAALQKSVDELIAKIDSNASLVGQQLTELTARVDRLETAKGLRKSIDGQEVKKSTTPEFGKGMFNDVLGLSR